jgi:hypothetical protein
VSPLGTPFLGRSRLPRIAKISVALLERKLVRKKQNRRKISPALRPLDVAFFENLVRSRGLEPPCLAALAPQASASASSATTARTNYTLERSSRQRFAATLDERWRFGDPA